MFVTRVQGRPARPPAQVALVQPPHRVQVGPKGLAHRGGQQGHPALLPLAVTDQDFLAQTFEVLHPEAEGLEQPQPGPVQQTTD
jgi:hypothetical protein